MGRKKRSQYEAAARAREGRHRSSITVEYEPEEPRFQEETRWTGGVNHHLSDSQDDWETDRVELDSGLSPAPFPGEQEPPDTDLELEPLNLDDAALADCIAREENRQTSLWNLSGLRMDLGMKEWKKAEANRSLGYNRQATSTKYKHAQKERLREAQSAVTRESAQAKSFVSYFQARRPSPPMPAPATEPLASGAAPSSIPPSSSASPPSAPPPAVSLPSVNEVPLYGFLSDEPSESDLSDEGDGSSDEDEEQSGPKKRRKLDISVREQKRLKKEQRHKELDDALTAIEKVLGLKRTQYQSPLQAKRARVIQSTLYLVVRRSRKLMEASAMAAETHGFAPAWGSRLARRWTARWVKTRDLPDSNRGRHAKTWSLLNDPAVKEELVTYLRSNKWSMNPAKLVEYSKATLITDEMKKFVQNAVNEEMPRSLKQYLELELFPRIGYKVVHGISVATARRWLHEQGFEYTEVKKGLFYDGHERPDNVDYRQNEFIPAFDALRPYFLEYQVENLELLVKKPPLPPGKFWLVLTAHDEMTAQANDADKWVWIMKGEMPIRKKGVGRGIHRSDILCSTFGHVVDAGQGIEYGKNYDGYWDGAQFIKQLEERIIPAFEQLHDRNIYRACFLIDNSQGHCAYAENALIVSRMNWRSGGKQAIMRDGWFWCNGQKVVQRMVLPDGQPKGMKLVLEERGLLRPSLKMKCDTGTCDGSHLCCGRAILSHQPDFLEQKSLVQETIERLGHQCLFLPKYHCELNFIEFFWGAVKRYLREHCDYTFEGLRARMDDALRSVDLMTIRKWERRTYRWLDAYRQGLDCKDAQFQVRKFSSRQFKSHRRVGERMGQVMDK
ncbi:hypothetical protein MSAN_01975000 [Mycena sanguinolenta]|uniref:Uncharacterized protein n=1 Tax=Mycena sanguinolenta TaxID=230812 RepID=A0A8H6XKY0_9AGAR|nr:hypothetical protein MSAN_01975000 [Mycena sanguinolenta]